MGVCKEVRMNGSRWMGIAAVGGVGGSGSGCVSMDGQWGVSCF